MSGKPFQSVLAPHEEEIREFRRQGVSYRNIAGKMNSRYGLSLTHNAVYSYLKRRGGTKPAYRLFFDGLDQDLKESLLKQICAVWTHGSTGLEGNTLTLGETLKVLGLGLTINGKPLRDHQEVYGHARAVDIIYSLVKKGEVSEQDLLGLHRAVMHQAASDIMNPVGGWKREFNGTTGVIGSDVKYMEYASPQETPALMNQWIEEFNHLVRTATDSEFLLDAYIWAHVSFVRIHPFFDGNGRIARLIANLPVLLSGAPPVVLSVTDRAKYFSLLWEYQNAVGVIKPGNEMLPDHKLLSEFKDLLISGWQETLTLVEEAHKRQRDRICKL
jgi:Fic family protein